MLEGVAHPLFIGGLFNWKVHKLGARPWAVPKTTGINTVATPIGSNKTLYRNDSNVISVRCNRWRIDID